MKNSLQIVWDKLLGACRGDIKIFFYFYMFSIHVYLWLADTQATNQQIREASSVSLHLYQKESGNPDDDSLKNSKKI